MTISLADLTSSAGFMPSGAILPFAGSTAPSGWLLCDGSAVSNTVYPTLYAVILNTYDTQTNPTTNTTYTAPGGVLFRVPDYRASMLRGVGTPYVGTAVTLGGWQTHTTAKNGMTVTNASSPITGGLTMNTSSITSLSLGLNDTNHSHNDNGHAHIFDQSGSTNWSAGTGVAYSQPGYTANQFTGRTGYASLSTQTANHSHGLISGTVAAQTLNSHTFVTTANVTLNTGDSETRPHNKGVNFIIKT